jgi:hypothetical protein
LVNDLSSQLTAALARIDKALGLVTGDRYAPGWEIRAALAAPAAALTVLAANKPDKEKP